MPKKSSNVLLDANSAVADFLDTLLQEATEAVPGRHDEKPAPVILMPEVESPTPHGRQSDPVESLPAQALRSPGTAHDAAAQAKETQAPANENPAVESQPAESDRLVSRQQDYTFPLQCLMFKVGDNRLSIPLIDLGSVLPWTDKLTRLPDAPDWYLGILQHRDAKFRVVDSARILQIKSTHERVANRHLLVFGDADWALSCDRLGEVLKLQPEDVQWSSQSTGSLALGTIRDSLAILLDPLKVKNHLEQL